jgi:hypothetical protein
MTKIKFKRSNDLSDNKVNIKNIGKVNEIANFLFVNNFNKKKKKEAMIIFINIMTNILNGFIKIT